MSRKLRPRFSLGAALLAAGLVAAFFGGWTSHRRDLRQAYQQDLETAQRVRDRLSVQYVQWSQVFVVPPMFQDGSPHDDMIGIDRVDHDMRMDQYQNELRALRLDR